MRKAFAAAVAALVGMGVSAQAADIYEGSLKDEPVYATAPIWTGLYVGGHIGGLWNKEGDNSLSKKKRTRHKECRDDVYWVPIFSKRGKFLGHKKKTKKICYLPDWKESDWSDWTKLDDAKSKSDETERSLLGGVHMGYNWQDGTRVYGLEGDVSFAKGIDYLASLRARLGHAVDHTLFYGTAGIAFAGFKDKTIDVEYGPYKDSFDISGDKKIGLVVGGGVEHKLAPNVSIGLEGLYYFFGDSAFSSESGAYCYNHSLHGCKGEKKYKFDHEDDNDLFVVRARLNYHLQEAYEEPLK